MESISRIITLILDLLVWPFGPERHTLGLVWLSLLSGAGMALVFRTTTDPLKIRAAKNRFRSYIYEMRIYQDSLRAVSVAFYQSLWSNVLYIRAVLPPLLILAIPMILVIAQLDARYGADHLTAGGTTVITLRLAGGTDPFGTGIGITSDSGAVVDAGPVRIPGSSEISWRVRVEEEGTHEASLSADGREYPFRLVAEPSHRSIGRSRGARPFEALLHPGLPPFPDGSGIEYIHVDYSGASYPLLFWRMHWIVIFLFYTVVGAAVIKLTVGLEI